MESRQSFVSSSLVSISSRVVEIIAWKLKLVITNFRLHFRVHLRLVTEPSTLNMNHCRYLQIKFTLRPASGKSDSRICGSFFGCWPFDGWHSGFKFKLKHEKHTQHVGPYVG